MTVKKKLRMEMFTQERTVMAKEQMRSRHSRLKVDWTGGGRVLREQTELHKSRQQYLNQRNFFLQAHQAVILTVKLGKKCEEEKASCSRKTCKETKAWWRLVELWHLPGRVGKMMDGSVQTGKTRSASVGMWALHINALKKKF